MIRVCSLQMLQRHRGEHVCRRGGGGARRGEGGREVGRYLGGGGVGRDLVLFVYIRIYNFKEQLKIDLEKTIYVRQ